MAKKRITLNIHVALREDKGKRIIANDTAIQRSFELDPDKVSQYEPTDVVETINAAIQQALANFR